MTIIILKKRKNQMKLNWWTRILFLKVFKGREKTLKKNLSENLKMRCGFMRKKSTVLRWRHCFSSSHLKLSHKVWLHWNWLSLIFFFIFFLILSVTVESSCRGFFLFFFIKQNNDNRSKCNSCFQYFYNCSSVDWKAVVNLELTSMSSLLRILHN